MAKQEKKCFIVRRYEVKSSGSICAIIRNGENKEYTTCLHANGRSSCTCEAGSRGRECYHVKHLRASEAARQTQPVQETQQEAPQQPVATQTTQDSAPSLAMPATVTVARSHDEEFKLLMQEKYGKPTRPKVSSAEASLSRMGLLHGMNEKRGGWLSGAGRGR